MLPVAAANRAPRERSYLFVDIPNTVGVDAISGDGIIDRCIAQPSAENMPDEVPCFDGESAVAADVLDCLERAVCDGRCSDVLEDALGVADSRAKCIIEPMCTQECTYMATEEAIEELGGIETAPTTPACKEAQRQATSTEFGKAQREIFEKRRAAAMRLCR